MNENDTRDDWREPNPHGVFPPEPLGTYTLFSPWACRGQRFPPIPRREFRVFFNRLNHS